MASIPRWRTDKHLFRAHPLWVAPDWAIELDAPLRLDAEDWIRQCREAQIDSLLFVTKQHDGRCVWPTRLDAPTIGHGYNRDFLGEICAAARSAGIDIVAYYSTAIDSAQVDRHPDWQFVDVEGKPSRAYGYAWVCLNSPYGEFALTQIAEILAYDVQCIWLDILSLGRPRQDCICDHCCRRYRDRCGGDLRGIAGTPTMGQWKIDCVEEHLSAIRDIRDRIRPAAAISFNGAGPGYRRHPEAGLDGRRLLKYIDFGSDEGHFPARESSFAKYLRGEGRPFEVLSGNGVGSTWVNFATKPSSLTTLEAAIVTAHGGTFGTGISVRANGTLLAGEMRLLGETGQWLAGRQEFLLGQTPLAEIAILCQPFRSNQPERPYRPPEAPLPAAPPAGYQHQHKALPKNALAGGIETALVEGHWQYDLLDEAHSLTESLGRYRIVILPDGTIVGAELAERLRDFVVSGGCLIVEGHATLLDEAWNRRTDFLLADLLGLHFEGYADAWDTAYLYLDDMRLADGLPGSPVQVDGPAVRVRCAAARALAQLGLPVGGLRTPDRHVGGMMNPPGPPTTIPSITINRAGRGQSIYVGVGLGSYISARRNQDPWAKVLASNLVSLLLTDPLLTTDAPPGVELLLARQRDRLIMYAFNHYLVHDNLGAARGGPALAPFRVSVNTARLGSVRSAQLAPDGVFLPVLLSSGYVSVDVPRLEIAEIVVFDSSD